LLQQCSFEVTLELLLATPSMEELTALVLCHDDTRIVHLNVEMVQKLLKVLPLASNFLTLLILHAEGLGGLCDSALHCTREV